MMMMTMIKYVLMMQSMNESLNGMSVNLINEVERFELSLVEMVTCLQRRNHRQSDIPNQTNHWLDIFYQY